MLSEQLPLKSLSAELTDSDLEAVVGGKVLQRRIQDSIMAGVVAGIANGTIPLNFKFDHLFDNLKLLDGNASKSP